MNRRGFIGSILAASVAPAAVGSGILMPVRPPVWTSDLSLVPMTATEADMRFRAWLEDVRRYIHAEFVINPPLVQQLDGSVRQMRVPAEPWFTLKAR